MVYGIGIIGFICGFALGQMILWFLLRHKSRKELLEGKGLQFYGLLCWLVAGLTSYSMVTIYLQYFPDGGSF